MELTQSLSCWQLNLGKVPPQEIRSKKNKESSIRAIFIVYKVSWRYKNFLHFHWTGRGSLFKWVFAKGADAEHVLSGLSELAHLIKWLCPLPQLWV